MSPRQHTPSTTPEDAARAESIARSLECISRDRCADQPQTTHPQQTPTGAQSSPQPQQWRIPRALHLYAIVLLAILSALTAGLFSVGSALSSRLSVDASTDINLPDFSDIENQLGSINDTIENFRNTYSTTDTGDIERHLEDINSSIDALHSALTDLELTIKYK